MPTPLYARKRKLVKRTEAEKRERTLIDIRTGKEEGKTISVGNLPDCYHKEMLLQFSDKEGKICVVACRSGIQNRWVAYAGFPDLKDTKFNDSDFTDIRYWSCQYVHDVASVKMLGEIIEPETAAQLFPDWDIEQYTNDRCLSPTLS